MSENPETPDNTDPLNDGQLATLVDLPEGAIPLGVVEVVSYLDDDGDTCYGFRWPASMSYSNVLGLLELVKSHVLNHYHGFTND